MSSDIATSMARDGARPVVRGRSRRSLAVQLLGPLTALGGVAWAVAQPYRLAFLDREGRGLYDYLFQPPLLVVAVGLLFALVVAPGLVDDLEAEEANAPEA